LCLAVFVCVRVAADDASDANGTGFAWKRPLTTIDFRGLVILILGNAVQSERHNCLISCL
jgi:hypothetical protein